MEKNSYPHQKIEAKWAKRWVKDKLYQASSNPKNKHYVLVMFPYPSGAGLHVGHVESYTAADIEARYRRMNGFDVLQPIGWDAFGLPTENYAIKTGRNPHQVTKENIEVFKKQLTQLGFSYDWDREINTSDPSYYKWTQWLFLKLYKAGLAYKAKAPANWCPSCKTVIADEQVVDGRCERCETKIRKKRIEQWFFAITKYAERLISDLSKVDWPQSTKIGQINWIGRSEGAEIEFETKNKELKIKVFTTRPDTLYGATFLAVSPDSELAEKIKAKKIKEAINPANKKTIPVFIADYVVGEYGSGAVMGVPAHDQRDFEFAKKRNLEVIEVIKGPKSNLKKEAYTGPGIIINSGEWNGWAMPKDTNKVIAWLEEKGIGRKKVNYHLRDWLVSRERYWGAPIPIVYCKDCGEQPVPEKELPIVLPKDIKDYKPKGRPPLAQSKKFMNTKCPKCGGNATREPKTLDTFVDSAWYFIRYVDPKNKKEIASQKAINLWLPVDFYIGGAEHTVGHLLYARFITKVLYDLGILHFDEPFKKLVHQGIVLGEDGRKMSKRWGNVIRPDEMADKFGADALRLYEMFMGPLEQMKPWSTAGIEGVKRFLNRVWQFKEKVTDKAADKEKILVATLVKKVTDYITRGRYNVAVSEFMKFLNAIEEQGSVAKSSWQAFLKTLAPFAPFITEELWSRLGNKYSIHNQVWPKVENLKTVEKTVKIPVQVNGKLRGMIEVEVTASKIQVQKKILNDPTLAKKLAKGKIKKVIYKPGQIVNIVTK